MLVGRIHWIRRAVLDRLAQRNNEEYHLNDLPPAQSNGSEERTQERIAVMNGNRSNAIAHFMATDEASEGSISSNSLMYIYGGNDAVPDNDLENQSSSRNRKRRCSGSPLRCLASNNPIVGAAASAYRATAETAGRVSNSAQSRLSRFRGRNDRTDSINGMNIDVGVGSIGTGVGDNEDEQESHSTSNGSVNSDASDFMTLLEEEYEYNIFRMLRDGYRIDVSQLEELGNWSQRESVLAASGLDGVDDLIALAGELQGAEELLEYFAIRAETKAFNVPLIKIVVLFHFPPNGQGLHINGVLYTGGKNHLPLNATMEEFFFMATHVIANQFGVSEPVARIIAMNKCVVVSAIPITLPYNAAGSPTYEDARVRSEEASVRHVTSAVEASGATHAIVLGSYPWKFYKKHPSIFDSNSVTVLQKFPLVHPSAMRISEHNSNRQVYELSQAFSDTVAHCSGVSREQFNIIDLQGPRSMLNDYITAYGRKTGDGQFFYYAWYGSGTSRRLVFLTRNREDMESLITNELESITITPGTWNGTETDFPTQPTLVNGTWGIGLSVSEETYQTTNQEYKYLTIGVVHWSDLIRDVPPSRSQRDSGASGHVTYRNIMLGNITLGIHNREALQAWRGHVTEQANQQLNQDHVGYMNDTANLANLGVRL